MGDGVAMRYMVGRTPNDPDAVDVLAVNAEVAARMGAAHLYQPRITYMSDVSVRVYVGEVAYRVTWTMQADVAWEGK